MGLTFFFSYFSVCVGVCVGACVNEAQTGKLFPSTRSFAHTDLQLCRSSPSETIANWIRSM